MLHHTCEEAASRLALASYTADEDDDHDGVNPAEQDQLRAWLQPTTERDNHLVVQ
jgi:hypothetical protein